MAAKAIGFKSGFRDAAAGKAVSDFAMIIHMFRLALTPLKPIQNSLTNNRPPMSLTRPFSVGPMQHKEKKDEAVVAAAAFANTSADGTVVALSEFCPDIRVTVEEDSSGRTEEILMPSLTKYVR